MPKHPEINGLRTWIEIDRTAIAENYKLLRGLLDPKTKFMAVVKSNAYGHSLLDFSKEIEGLGADWLGVDSVVEAEALRENGIKLPILVLGYTLPEKYSVAAQNNISIAISSVEGLEGVSKVKEKISIHIKVDTGMHRQGFMKEDIESVISIIKKLPENVIVEGLFTHFASAKEPAMSQKTKEQVENFELWQSAFRSAGLSVMTHMAGSAGTILYPETRFDMVRFGSAMYGIWASSEVRDFTQKTLPLKPILSWKTVIGEVKNVKAGEGIGYDFTEILTRDSRVAICPIGYWHGLPLAVSRVGKVAVCGKSAKILGRVSMDMTMIDVTDIPEAKVGSVVTVLGRDGETTISPESIAEAANSSGYEVVTRINPLIKRVFLK